MQSPHNNTIHTIDLNFMGIPGTIASYLILHSGGGILVECGPGSTIEALEAGLVEYGLSVNDITDLLLTHIHLDHAGAAGWLARQGVNVYVHPVGAPHLQDPEKLLKSASRIYGDLMDTLWGEFLPVPAERLIVPEDGDVIEINGRRFRALDTPGHANHHYVYIYDDVCFSGDVGGVRLTGINHLRVPMPPPEFNLEKWADSLSLLKDEYAKGSFSRIAPTHFGIFDDTDWHLSSLEIALNEIGDWIERVMPCDPPIENLNDQFLAWTHQRSLDDGLTEDKIAAYEAANPSWMSSYGIQRYWRKYRQPAEKK